jgi:hypothetical protein
MLKLSLLLAAIAVGGYLFRRNFRRFFPVFRNGDEKLGENNLEQKWKWPEDDYQEEPGRPEDRWSLPAASKSQREREIRETRPPAKPRER